MRVTLVLAPAFPKRSPLIGLAYLVASLKSGNHTVNLLDLNIDSDFAQTDNEYVWQDKAYVDSMVAGCAGAMEDMAGRILATKPRVVGFSVWSTTKYVSLELARRIKERDAGVIIVFGGPECSFGAESLVSDTSVDAVVVGEGESSFLELLGLIERYDAVKPCDGVFTKEKPVDQAGFRTEIDDLDMLPFPDYTLFDLQKYRSPSTISMTFYRGCIRRCAFCNTAVTWHRFRSRSAARIFAEIQHQVRQYPSVQKFEIDDTALNLNLPMVSDLCDMLLAGGTAIKWGGSALIRREMSSELIRKMARAGCNCIGYGLESGSQKIIDRIGKGFTVTDAQRVIRDTFSAGIETILGIVIGFPGETRKEFNETLAFIKTNKDYISWVHTPSECCIGCNSYLQQHPERFDAVLSPHGGQLWRSADGTNTHEERLRRIEEFYAFLQAEGVRTTHYSKVHSDKEKRESQVH